MSVVGLFGTSVGFSNGAAIGCRVGELLVSRVGKYEGLFDGEWSGGGLIDGNVDGILLG